MTVVLLAAGCASRRPETHAAATIPRLRRAGAGYAVPSPLPAGGPGSVIAASATTTSAVLGGAARTELLYHSNDRTGADVAVSGVVLVPPGTAPAGGWPVVSWGHGTTGVADACTPSTTPNLFYNEYAQVARGFLAAGYAVVATDYLGLGTPGLHSYSVGVDLGNAMADIVAAARSVNHSLSTTWFGVGHSEGGQAALFASRAAARHPGLRLAGTVAIAPSSQLVLALPAIAHGDVPADVVYGLYLLAGLSRVDPSVKVADLAGPAARDQLDLVLNTGCLPEALDRFRGVDIASVFDIPDATMSALSGLLAEVGEPDRTATAGPLLVVQGDADHDIPPPATAALVARLTALGVDVTSHLYPGLDHDGVLGPSSCDTLAWMASHGGPAPRHCVPSPTDLS